MITTESGLRARPVEETLAWLMPMLPRVGISRVAEVTWLDAIGMPVFQCIRPRSRNYVVSQGKGLSAAQAKVSAILESVELFHAEEISIDDVASIRSVRSSVSYDPTALPAGEPVDSSLSVGWVQGRNLVTGRVELVPHAVVSTDYSVHPRVYRCPWRRTTNGLASGNTREEALLHGLYETIERDCLGSARAERVALAGLPEVALDLIERAAGAGVEVNLFQLPNTLGLPCFKAVSIEPGTALNCYGSACRSDKGAALVGAITEALQSRLTVISGSRDDLEEGVYLRFRVGVAPRTDARPGDGGAPFADLPTHTFASAAAELDFVLDRLERTMCVRAIAVDLTRADLGVPVYFTLSPGLSHNVKGHAS